MDDFSLLCFDFVSSPSVQGSYMNPLNESKNHNIISNTNTNKYSKVEKIITDIISDFK